MKLSMADTATPVGYWLSIPLVELEAWIEAAVRVQKEWEAKK